MKCSHCSLNVPRGLIAEGAAHQFCCSGCKLVFETLQGAGLNKYYDMVEGEAADQRQASEVSKRSYSDFDFDEFTDEHVTQVENESIVKFYLRGVHCAACVWLVEKLPTLVDGVIRARLDLGRSIVSIEWHTSNVKLSRIAEVLDSIGYPPVPIKDGEELSRLQKEQRSDLLRIAVAGALAGNLMGIAFALYGAYWSGMEPSLRNFFRYTAMGLAAISVAWPGRVFYQGAWAAVRTRTPNMDLPIALGLSAGFCGGVFNTITNRGEVYFESVGVLVFLLLVGRYIQTKQQRNA
ncbi:MAG: heavy metal translocating P-type ATPase metal-binding domain-containing protein, partial [Planctomycetota bacterium]|nr:heavy metal translocating P-type ATPase metal-binding domain-containing protein [Planctomycetota bacterium]